MSTSPWDCLSCGAHAQVKAFCETCGAAQPIEGEDTSLSMMLGLVCGSCDGYNDPGAAVCASCGKPLGEQTDLEPTVPIPLPKTVPPADPATLPIYGPPSPALTPPMQAAVSLERAARAEPPSWMSAPTGQPLATQFALPKVDLATVARSPEGHGIAAPAERVVPMPPPEAHVMMPTATPLATPMPTLPAPDAKKATPCARCGTPREHDDKFCRNCGARSDAPVAASPMATTQIAMGKMPGPLPSPMFPQGATMVLPAMHAAQASAGAVGEQPAIPPGGATMFFGAAPVERTAKLILVRGQSQFGTQWRLHAQETVLGRSVGAVLFPDDAAMAPSHCKLVFHGVDLWLEPVETQNGVFLRVRDAVRLKPGDEVVVGSQRLRILADTERPTIVNAEPGTRTLGSLVRTSPPIMLLRIGSEPAHNEVFHRCQRLLTIGRNNCDLNFPRDSFVSERHAQMTHDGQALVLEDLRSRNGTYVRVREPTKLLHGDLVLLGDKVLRVELPR